MAKIFKNEMHFKNKFSWRGPCTNKLQFKFSSLKNFGAQIQKSIKSLNFPTKKYKEVQKHHHIVVKIHCLINIGIRAGDIAQQHGVCLASMRS